MKADRFTDTPTALAIPHVPCPAHRSADCPEPHSIRISLASVCDSRLLKTCCAFPDKRPGPCDPIVRGSQRAPSQALGFESRRERSIRVRVNQCLRLRGGRPRCVGGIFSRPPTALASVMICSRGPLLLTSPMRIAFGAIYAVARGSQLHGVCQTYVRGSVGVPPAPGICRSDSVRVRPNVELPGTMRMSHASAAPSPAPRAHSH